MRRLALVVSDVTAVWIHMAGAPAAPDAATTRNTNTPVVAVWLPCLMWASSCHTALSQLPQHRMPQVTAAAAAMSLGAGSRRAQQSALCTSNPAAASCTARRPMLCALLLLWHQHAAQHSYLAQGMMGRCALPGGPPHSLGHLHLGCHNAQLQLRPTTLRKELLQSLVMWLWGTHGQRASAHCMLALPAQAHQAPQRHPQGPSTSAQSAGVA